MNENDIDQIENAIKLAEHAIHQLHSDFYECLKDQSIPLEERWELYLRTPQFLATCDSEIKEFVHWEGKLVDLLVNEDEHTTIDIAFLFSKMMHDRPDTDPVALKEEILATGMTAFTLG